METEESEEPCLKQADRSLSMESGKRSTSLPEGQQCRSITPMLYSSQPLKQELLACDMYSGTPPASLGMPCSQLIPPRLLSSWMSPRSVALWGEC